jgi:hypothetical protein
VFLTDSLKAAREYADLKAHSTGTEPLVITVTLPALSFQGNGSPEPPWFADDWHSDSMPGNAYEYDAVVPVSALSF